MEMTEANMQPKAPINPAKAASALLKASKNRWLGKLLYSDAAFGLYRTLDNELFLQGMAGPSSLLITSAGRGEGRSTVAVLAAINSAIHDGRRVLLVDADVGRRRGKSLLGLAADKPGLGEFFRGEAEIDAIIQPTALDNLCVVNARRQGKDMFRFSNTLFEMFLERAKKDFDIIIVDGPAAVSNSDAITISKMVGNVVIVVQYAGPNREQVQGIIAKLRTMPVRVLGVVMNRRRLPIPRLLYGLR